MPTRQTGSRSGFDRRITALVLVDLMIRERAVSSWIFATISTMNYSLWTKKNLRFHKTKHGRQATAVWCTKDESKPLAVLVHGINGDRHGLVPLAAELENEYRLAIVELPGHGRSGPLPLPTSASLEVWFEDILKQVEKQFGPASFIAAHSFGCLAVISPSVLRRRKVVLLCPVPTPSQTYQHYAEVVTNVAGLIGHIYNWRILVLLRSMVLSKVNTPEARKRVRWTGWRSKPSYSNLHTKLSLAEPY